MSKTILVTGGAGFIGSNLVNALVQKKSGDEIVIIDDLSSGNKSNVHHRARLIKQDLADQKSKTIITNVNPRVIYHLAAQKSVTHSVADPYTDLNTNLIGLLNLLEAARKLNPRPKIIFSSTGGAIYGDKSPLPTPETAPAEPASPYGITKLTSEKYLHFYRQQYGLDSTVLRFANVYGPRQDPNGEAGVIAIFFQKALQGEPLTVFGDGRQTRDYVFVKDAVKALIDGAQNNLSEPINIGTGQETTVLELIVHLKKILNKKVQVVFKPARAGEQKRSVLNAARANKLLAFSPQTSLSRGMRITAEWFLDN